MRESREKLKINKEDKELEELRQRFEEWREKEGKALKEIEAKEKDREILQMRERLGSIKVKELAKPQLKMFETFEKFVINKEPEEEFNWKEFQTIRIEALDELRKEPNNSKRVSINLISEKLEPLVIRQQQEEENR